MKKPTKKPTNKKTNLIKAAERKTSFNKVIMAQKRTNKLANQIISDANLLDDKEQAGNGPAKDIFKRKNLRVIFLGGQDSIGAKNMIVVEYHDEALILDCGNELGLDLPGVNYAIPDTGYLKTIKHKLKGYVLSHGHLDHIGGLPHIIIDYPAPIYGSHFTIGMAKKALSGVSESAQIIDKLKFVEMNMDNHEKLVVGKHFKIELVRITHSIPESSLIVVDTPDGKVINTGDFRLDPEPLDKKPSDIERLKELGREGVLLLLSESTNTQTPDRTPTEHTLQDSFHDIIKKSPGRIFVASFSSNINRIQMVINSASQAGRKVAIDGRSMIQHIELAIRMGLLKIPKDTIVPIAQLPSLDPSRILLLCTGGQGETGAVMQKASLGEHKYLNLKSGDTVVISSKPIPGNMIDYERLSNNLVKMGCKVYRAPTWEIDGAVGPLHVSGHGYRDEHREMIELVKPKFLAPIYAGELHRYYHKDVAVSMAGMKPDDVLLANNGDMLVYDQPAKKFKLHKQAVPTGSVLIDDSSQLVPSVVIRDRLLMTENGLVVIILTISHKTGRLLSNPDIITRGFIYIKDNTDLMNVFRSELKRAVQQRFTRVPLDRFKSEIRDYASHFLFDKTQRNPIVIPVVNIVSQTKSPKTAKAKKNRLTKI